MHRDTLGAQGMTPFTIFCKEEMRGLVDDSHCVFRFKWSASGMADAQSAVMTGKCKTVFPIPGALRSDEYKFALRIVAGTVDSARLY